MIAEHLLMGQHRLINKRQNKRSLRSLCQQFFHKPIFHTLLYPLCGGLAVILILLFVSLYNPTVVAAQTSDPVQQTPAPPIRCRVASHVMALTDFNFAEGTFYTNFWLNGNCNNPDAPTTEGLYFLSAKNYEMRAKETIKGVGEGNYWYANVQGNFRHDWDLQNYPFDRHTLKIFFETSSLDATKFLYEPDPKHSGIHKSILLEDGWQITNFSINASATHYDNNFGDPRATADTFDMANMSIRIEIKRISYLGFVKLVGGVYIAFSVCVVCFLLDTSSRDLYSASLGLLVGVLFAVFVNLQVAQSTLGTTETMTLTDKIHVVTMFYIMMGILIQTLLLIAYEKQWKINIKYL